MNINDHLRIRRFDDKNIVIEKKMTKNWKILGYFSSVFQAIEWLLNHDGLLDLNEIKSLSELSTAFTEQIRQVKELIYEATKQTEL